MRMKGKKVPPEFSGIIDEALLSRTIDYSVEKNRLGTVQSIVTSALVMVFFFGGGLSAYDALFASLQVSFPLAGTGYFICLSLFLTAVSVPFDLYGTFRVENKYGFNTMSLGLWIRDFVKSTFISLLIGGMALFVSLWVISVTPNFWWLIVWGFFLALSIFLMYISPYVIEPLFNKFTPVGGDIEDDIRALMTKADLSVSKVFKVDASKRSSHTNAYFTGFGRVKRIVLYDTLLSTMDRKRILAILAHEVGHWKLRHVLKRIILFEMLSLVGIYCSFRILSADVLGGIIGLSQATFFSQVTVLALLYGIVGFPITPLFSYLSRRDEDAADRFAVHLTSDSEGLAGALLELSKDNLSNLHPHPLFAWFYYSHPPVLERVRALRMMD